MIGSAADGTLHVISEIALQHAHLSSLVIGQYVRDQVALLALVDGLEISRCERGDAVPPVDVGLAFVAEEERAAIIGAQDDHSLGFWPEITYLAVSGSAPEMVRSNGEQPAAAQVSEDQAGVAVLAAHQREVEHVSAGAVHGYGFRKDDAIPSVGGHVVHQDRPRGCVGHVDEGSAVRIVVRDDILQPG